MIYTDLWVLWLLWVQLYIQYMQMLQCYHDWWWYETISLLHGGRGAKPGESDCYYIMGLCRAWTVQWVSGVSGLMVLRQISSFWRGCNISFCWCKSRYVTRFFKCRTWTSLRNWPAKSLLAFHMQKPSNTVCGFQKARRREGKESQVFPFHPLHIGV